MIESELNILVFSDKARFTGEYNIFIKSSSISDDFRSSKKSLHLKASHS